MQPFRACCANCVLAGGPSSTRVRLHSHRILRRALQEVFVLRGDRILVIDDDVEMCTMLAEYLESERLHAEVVHDGETGLKRALSGDHSVIVLDVMLPGMNGLEVLRRLRSVSNARVVLLTARGEELDRIVGLEVGADDYVPKRDRPKRITLSPALTACSLRT
jgi:CheY-like chemotaxis protein